MHRRIDPVDLGAFGSVSPCESPRRRMRVQWDGGLALRHVVACDAPNLQAIMNSCVTGSSPFHGRCHLWSATWAEEMIRLRPDSLIITKDGLPIAFHDVAPARPPLVPLRSDATVEERRAFAFRRQHRSTFRITAVGIRVDVVPPDEAVRMFRRMLFYGGRTAQTLGYEWAECFAPWLQHPKASRPWTDYPSCRVVDTFRNRIDGSDLHRLRWRLEDVNAALAREGANEPDLEVVRAGSNR